METNLYLIYSCDLNGYYEELEHIVDSVDDLYLCLKQCIDDGICEINNDYNWTNEEQKEYVTRLHNSCNKIYGGEVDLNDLNTRIRYCTIEEATIWRR